MAALARRVMDESALGSPVGGTRTGLDWCTAQTLVDDSLLDNNLAPREVSGTRGADLENRIRAQFREQQNLVLDRLFNVDHDRQRFVLNDHQVGGVGPGLTGLGDDCHDRFTDITDRANRQEWATHLGGEVWIVVRIQADRFEVVGREDPQHSGNVECAEDVDRLDRGVGHRRPQVGDPRCVREVEVFDVFAAFGQHP